jgi:hypothetical protein
VAQPPSAVFFVGCHAHATTITGIARLGMRSIDRFF